MTRVLIGDDTPIARAVPPIKPAPMFDASGRMIGLSTTLVRGGDWQFTENNPPHGPGISLVSSTVR
jgi:hypothetical protein